jgi:5'-3' exonuclease
MIALALLLGCDYLPAGVPGVGKETAVKLFTSLPGVDLLNRWVVNALLGDTDVKNTRGPSDEHSPLNDRYINFMSMSDHFV